MSVGKSKAVSSFGVDERTLEDNGESVGIGGKKVILRCGHEREKERETY